MTEFNARPVFCIVDPSLVDFVGHHYAYDDAVARASANRGFQPLVLANCHVSKSIAERLAIVPCFRRDIWEGLRTKIRPPSRYKTLTDIVWGNVSFYTDLSRYMRRTVLPPGSVLFAHMLFRNQLLALARFLSTGRGGNINALLLLRYQPQFYEDSFSTLAFRLLESAAKSGRNVRLASDSTRLARDLSHLTSLPIEVLPIPHSLGDTKIAQTVARNRLTFASLGSARDEKGIFEVLDAIRLLEPERLNVEFLVQANNALPEVQAALERFKREEHANVRLCESSLSPEEYASALEESDVVLLPYWRDIYASRTSGIFLEAASAGKPVIATADTWMSDELSRYGAGLTIRDRDPAALADAIRTAFQSFDRLSQQARASQKDCIALHNADRLVDAVITHADETVARHRPRRLAVFYPWGDFLSRRAGASVRVNDMIDVLAPYFEEIRVLQSGPSSEGSANNGSEDSGNNVTVIGQQLRRRHHLLRRAVRAPLRILLGKEAFGQDLMLWFHLERIFDRGFQKRAVELSKWADAVLLEYTFWGSVVLRASRLAGKPVVLTNYDLVSEQVTASRPLKALTWMLERSALVAASTVVTVSQQDRETLAARGIQTHLIPNPAHVQEVGVTADEARAALRVVFGIELRARPYALFVGSWYPPNIEAVEQIRAIARELPECTFVVAGAAARPENDSNFLALGSIDDIVLRLLYRAAALALVPLARGTGSSLKTLEAMGAGVTVLGTSVAFRGLQSSAKTHCLIEDDLNKWPDLIRHWIHRPDDLRHMALSARCVAEEYFPDSVLVDYLALLGLDVDTTRSRATVLEKQRLQAEASREQLIDIALCSPRPAAVDFALELVLNDASMIDRDPMDALKAQITQCVEAGELRRAEHLLRAARRYSEVRRCPKPRK